MSIPPSKRLRANQARAEESRVPLPGSSRSSDEEPLGPTAAAHARDGQTRDGTTDSDPAGRLLHSLRDRDKTDKAAPSPAPPGPGARVRVLRGPFVGKSGVVQELDGRGGARVMLGLLSARIDLTDLAMMVEGGTGRERMTLSSSHRKPR